MGRLILLPSQRASDVALDRHAEHLCRLAAWEPIIKDKGCISHRHEIRYGTED